MSKETLKAVMIILQNSTYGTMGKGCDEELKQETIEEAANIESKNHYKDQSDYWAIGFDSFKRGAKWQAEKMYSVEEVIKAIGTARVFYKTDEDDGYDEFKHTPIEIIHSLKQFKK